MMTDSTTAAAQGVSGWSEKKPHPGSVTAGDDAGGETEDGHGRMRILQDNESGGGGGCDGNDDAIDYVQGARYYAIVLV